MATEDKFIEAIGLIHANRSIPAHKTGTAINVTDSGCDVTIDGEPTLTDVRFFAIIDDITSKIIIRPKEGSKVLVGMIDGIVTEAYIAQCSEIDSVTVIIETVVYKLSKDGHLVKKGTDSLLQALKLLIEGVTQIVVLEGNNPDYVKLNQALTMVQNILQDA